MPDGSVFPAATAIPASVMAPHGQLHPDALILAAQIEFDAAHDDLIELRRKDVDDFNEADDRTMDSIMERMDRAVNRASAIPARTAEGIRAKAGMVVTQLEIDNGGQLSGAGQTDWSTVLAWRLLREAAGLPFKLSDGDQA